MKIVICTNYFHPSVGGSEYVTEVVAKYLSLFHDVFVFTKAIKKRERTKFLPVRIVDYLPSNSTDFMKKMQTVNPDVILIYSDVFDYFKELVLSTHSLKAKIILATCGANWLHDNPSCALSFYRKIDRLHAIVCHSEYGQDYDLCSSKNMLAKTHIIPNGVCLSDFDNLSTKSEIANKYNLPEDRKWSVSVSNFLPGKGQEHALKIANKLDVMHIQISSDILFSAIGAVQEGRWKKRNSKGQALLKNIPHTDILSILRASNILLFTSEKEVAPIVMLEAMSSELPWVSTDVGNVISLDGGLCVSAPKDAKYNSIFNDTVISSLTVMAKELLSKPTLGKEGRKQVERHFQWESILPKYNFLIES